MFYNTSQEMCQLVFSVSFKPWVLFRMRVKFPNYPDNMESSQKTYIRAAPTIIFLYIYIAAFNEHLMCLT